jgi:hypothetical protein
MEAEQTEKQLLKSIDWAPLLWIVLAFGTMSATNWLGLALLKHSAIVDESLAKLLADIFSSLVFYLLLWLPIWRDGAVSSAGGGIDNLGSTAKKFLIFLAVLTPFGINLLWFLATSSADGFARNILAESQQFQGLLLLAFWSSNVLLFMVGVILAPIVEERFFRQWFWKRLEPRGLPSTIVSTSITFILIHPVDLVGKIALVPLTALVVFARIRSGGPNFGIWLHGINNVVAIMVAQVLVARFQ